MDRAITRLCTALLLTLPSAAFGQSAATPSEPYEITLPYAVIGLRSPDRVRRISEYMFDLIRRPDIQSSLQEEIVKDITSGGTLDGVNLQDPVGMAIFPQLPPAWKSLPQPTPEEIPAAGPAAEEAEDEAVVPVEGPAYVELASGAEVELSRPATNEAPADEAGFDWESLFAAPSVVTFAGISDFKAAQRVLDSGFTASCRLTAVPDRTDAWRMMNGVNSEATIRTVPGGVYFTGVDSLPLLDRVAELPTPPLALLRRHDAMASLRFDAISPRHRQLFIDTIWRAAGPALQRRDEEAADEFTLREATSRSTLELIDLLLDGASSLTAALDVDEAAGKIKLQFDMHARPGSELARRLESLDGPASRFAAAFDEKAAVCGLLCVDMNEFERKLMHRWLDFYDAALTATDFDPVQEQFKLVAKLARSTVDAGVLDVLAVFDVESPTDFAICGAMRVQQGNALRQALQEAFRLAQIQDSGEPALIVEDNHGSPIWKIRDGEGAEATECCFTIAAGAFWIGYGVGPVSDRMKTLIDRTENQASPETETIRSPLMITARAERWQHLPEPVDQEGRIQRVITRDAFADADALRLILHPIGDGARMEGTLDAGFLRWLGLEMSRSRDVSDL